MYILIINLVIDYCVLNYFLAGRF